MQKKYIYIFVKYMLYTVFVNSYDIVQKSFYNTVYKFNVTLNNKVLHCVFIFM